MSEKENNKNTLGFLGVEYQERLIKVLFENGTFFTDMYHILDQNMFSEEIHRIIIMSMKELYRKRGLPPRYDEISLSIRTNYINANNGWKDEMVIATIEKIKAAKSDGQDMIMETSENFFKQQNLIKAINKATEVIKNGEYNRYNEIESWIQDALQTNANKDYGHYNPFEDGWESALDDDSRIAIPTGFLQLDQALRGGLAKGELGVIVAPAGTAKTSTTTGFVVNAAITKNVHNDYKGYKVMHIHIEDDKQSIKRKEYGYLLNIEQQDLSKPDVRGWALQMLKSKEFAEIKQMMTDNIDSYRPETMSAHEVEKLIKKNIALGKKPDLVIVDYFEALELEKGEKGDSLWDKEKLTMRAFEKICKKYDLAIWLPVQGSRAAFNQEEYGAEALGGSIAKAQVCHVLITLARTDEMRATNKINLAIKKFRNGAISGASIMNNVDFNNGTCRFSWDREAVDEMVQFEDDKRSIIEEVRKEKLNI